MNEKASVSKELNEQHRTILQGLLKLPENRECADCKVRGPLWASVNLGIFVCMQCSGIHRSLGVHISKVRSVRLDTWLPEQVSFIQTMGNKIANEYWEAELPPNYDRVGIENFIRAKYEDKRWVPRDKKIAPPKPIEPKPETKSDNASKISIKSAEKKSSTNQNFVIPKIPFPFGISSESTAKVESTNHDTPPLAEIDGSDSPPKIIDQTVDLFSGFSVDETSGKDEKVDSLFDDDGWANFESAETTTIEKEKEKTKSSIEDLFYDTLSVTPLPPVPEKTEKNSKDDIMSLFDKSNMASPFAIHQQQQIAYAHQQALLSMYSTGVNTTNNNEINSTEVNEASKTSSPFETPNNSLDEFDFSSLTKDLFSKR